MQALDSQTSKQNVVVSVWPRLIAPNKTKMFLILYFIDLFHDMKKQNQKSSTIVGYFFNKVELKIYIIITMGHSKINLLIKTKTCKIICTYQMEVVALHP